MGGRRGRRYLVVGRLVFLGGCFLHASTLCILQGGLEVWNRRRTLVCIGIDLRHFVVFPLISPVQDLYGHLDRDGPGRRWIVKAAFLAEHSIEYNDLSM